MNINEDDDDILRPDLDEFGVRHGFSDVETLNSTMDYLNNVDRSFVVSQSQFKSLSDSGFEVPHGTIQESDTDTEIKPETVDKHKLLVELRVLKAKSKFTRMDDVIKLVESM